MKSKKPKFGKKLSYKAGRDNNKLIEWDTK